MAMIAISITERIAAMEEPTIIEEQEISLLVSYSKEVFLRGEMHGVESVVLSLGHVRYSPWSHASR
jgi:hypothetical protein